MKRVCGRLWEVVVHESQMAGSHFRGEARTHPLLPTYLYCTFSLSPSINIDILQTDLHTFP